MRRRGVCLTAAVAVMLATWHGVLAGLPHDHIGHTSAARGEACPMTHSGDTVEHLHPSTVRPGHPVCLACLVAGTTGAVGARAATFSSPRASDILEIEPPPPRAPGSAHLPPSRAPPAIL